MRVALLLVVFFAFASARSTVTVDTEQGSILVPTKSLLKLKALVDSHSKLEALDSMFDELLAKQHGAWLPSIKIPNMGIMDTASAIKKKVIEVTTNAATVMKDTFKNATVTVSAAFTALNDKAEKVETGFGVLETAEELKLGDLAEMSGATAAWSEQIEEVGNFLESAKDYADNIATLLGPFYAVFAKDDSKPSICSSLVTRNPIVDSAAAVCPPQGPHGKVETFLSKWTGKCYMECNQHDNVRAGKLVDYGGTSWRLGLPGLAYTRDSDVNFFDFSKDAKGNYNVKKYQGTTIEEGAYSKFQDATYLNEDFGAWCKEKCDPKYTNKMFSRFGAVCNDPHRKMYKRTLSYTPTCPANYKYIFGKCRGLPKLACPTGQTGYGPLCFSACPTQLPQHCGPYCTKDKTTCLFQMGSIAVSTIIAGLKISAIVSTAGAALPALLTAKAVVDAGTGAALAAVKIVGSLIMEKVSEAILVYVANKFNIKTNDGDLVKAYNTAFARVCKQTDETATEANCKSRADKWDAVRTIAKDGVSDALVSAITDADPTGLLSFLGTVYQKNCNDPTLFTA